MSEQENGAADTANGLAAEEETVETGAQSESDEGSEQEGKPAKSFTQEELDAKLAKQHSRAERRYTKQLGELRAEIQELREAQKGRGEKPDAGREDAKEPKRNDFDSYEEYIEARADYRAGQRIAKELAALNEKAEAESTSRTQKDEQARLVALADRRIEAGRKEFPDFDAVMQDAFDEGLIEQGSELYIGIIESDVGHRIAVHLAKNPEEAARINKLSPRGVHRELGKLEDRLAKPQKERAATIEPVNGSGRPSRMNDPLREDISMDDFVRLRNAAEQKRRGY